MAWCRPKPGTPGSWENLVFFFLLCFIEEKLLISTFDKQAKRMQGKRKRPLGEREDERLALRLARLLARSQLLLRLLY